MNIDYEEITPVDCEERGIDVKWKDKLIIIKQGDVIKDEFREPKQYYVINGFSDRVYFKTIKRSKAREWADEIWGKDKYSIRSVIKAQVR